MLVYEAVGETLRRLGIETVFGLVGGGNYAMVDHMARNCGITYYGARHEAAAVGMADGYARASGRLGVATVIQGPGLTNTLTALVEAAKSRTPLLLLAGDTPTGSLHGNQDVDQAAVAGSVGVGVQRSRGASWVVEDVVRAARRAEVERRPVLLSLTVDVQEGECDLEDVPPLSAAPTLRCRPSAVVIRQAADLLEEASKPVILGGRGAVLADARRPLEDLGDRIGTLFATSAQAKGLFVGNPFDLGIAGGFSSPLAVRLLAQADLVLSFGVSLNTWTTRHGTLVPPSARIVHFDAEAAAIGRVTPVALGAVGDAAETAGALLDELELRGTQLEGFRTTEMAEEISGFSWKDEIEDEGTEVGMDPRSLMAALDRVLPAQRTVAVDSGHFMGFPAMHLSVPDPRGFVFAQAFQSVGLGLATGMGAAVARPERLAVVVIGDGGLMMSLGELDAAVHHELPLLVVVVNDAAYGAEVHHFESLGLPTDLARFRDRDLASVASAMGARGATVCTLGDLEHLKGWLSAPSGPMVLDCKVNPRVRAEWLAEAFR